MTDAMLQGSEIFTFSCKRWLARGEDDSAIERELVPDKIVQEITKKDGSIKRKEISQKGKLEGMLYPQKIALFHDYIYLYWSHKPVTVKNKIGQIILWW